ncbi:uncharacterized protein VTP21DRAFT_11719 [Calcarisporiella thermophila]|uniref:uncharacterized protein n=1 Tax=Calcarisporiella thermophila TaxID=911321 RepID=UPI00374221D7
MHSRVSICHAPPLSPPPPSLLYPSEAANTTRYKQDLEHKRIKDKEKKKKNMSHSIRIRERERARDKGKEEQERSKE